MGKKQIALESIDKLKIELRREISSFMKDRGLSQYDVAKICDLPSPYVNQILSSKSKAVSIEKLLKVGRQIGMRFTLMIDTK